LRVSRPTRLTGWEKVYSAADGEDPLAPYLQQPLTIYLGEADDRNDDRNNSAEARARARRALREA